MPELHDTLAKEGATLLIKKLYNFPCNNGIPQSNNGITYGTVWPFLQT